MALSLQECIDKIKKEYPNYYPYAYVESEGKYVFNLVGKGINPEEAISDMHVVDPQTGYISGGMSIVEFVKDSGFREAWKHANLVANHDESLGHSSIRSSRDRGWSVRRNQNRNENVPFGYGHSEDDLIYGGSLSHHGIKGQSWGVRNGPPYPLDQKTHNKVVENKNKPKPRAVSGNDGKTGMISPFLVELAAESMVLLSFLAINAYRNSPSQQRKRQDKFSKRNEEVSEDLIGDIADVGKKYSSDDMPPSIKGKHSPEDDMMACNPRYNNGTIPGTSSNCTLCAYTYDLRRRGYDVMALASDTGNHPQVLMNSLYKDAKRDEMKARSFFKLFEQAEKKYPEGARGELSVYGPFMGHSVAWEIRNGKLEVFDTQRNVKMTPKDFQELGFDPSVKGTAFTRTDNLELKPEGIHLVSAGYKPNARKIISEERRKIEEAKKMSDSERRQHYAELYLKEHPNADKNAAGLKNWVEAQMNK